MIVMGSGVMQLFILPGYHHNFFLNQFLFIFIGISFYFIINILVFEMYYMFNNDDKDNYTLVSFDQIMSIILFSILMGIYNGFVFGLFWYDSYILKVLKYFNFDLLITMPVIGIFSGFLFGFNYILSSNGGKFISIFD